MRQFIEDLLCCSEKAACIARACRQEKELFELLIEEKTGDAKNHSFCHDFKTLADVLIQETVRHEMGQKYPELVGSIFGEESNKFTNTLGESILVQICSTPEETSKLLSKVLTGNQGAADILAKLVHSQIEISEKTPDDIPEDFKIDDLGIWIDPIDGTNNYIKGTNDEIAMTLNTSDMLKKGLPVVTVLVGVFDKTTGLPVIGVVNQPFADYDKETKSWTGKIHWGYNINDKKYTNIPPTPGKNGKIVLSCNEPSDLIDRLKPHYDCVTAGGAGYKSLCVCLGLVDLYVSSRPSTYNWDTCAGQGLLISMGGNCVQYSNPGNVLTYNTPNAGQSGIAQWCNDQGVIAYRQLSDLEQLKKILE